MSSEDCLFCKIVAGDVPADVVLTTGHAVAFRDINPQAPTHVLVIPRSHHADAAALAAEEPSTLAHLVDVAAKVARGGRRLRLPAGVQHRARARASRSSTPTCTCSAAGR